MSWQEDLKTDTMMIPSKVIHYAHEHATNYQEFCRWIQNYKDNLLIRVFAFKLMKDNTVRVIEIERGLVSEEYCVQRNVIFSQMAGYRVQFERKTKKKYSYGYSYSVFRAEDFNVWYCERPIPEHHGRILNIQDLFEIPKYKYCGYSEKQGLKEYLKYYEKDPAVEYFGKAGLRYQPMLGKKVKKDKAFAKFILRNVADVNRYGYQITVYAYEHKVSFKEADNYLEKKHRVDHDFKDMDKVDYKVDRIKIREWFDNREDTDGTCDKSYKTGCWKNGFRKSYGWSSYKDYWNSCVFLGLDMRDTKNSMPKDFARMHDIRIDEYKSKKAALDEKKKREFNKYIKKAADAFTVEVESDKYTVRLPETKQDFENEGKALHHCVGSMGYDKKVVDGKIIIAFIRDKNEIDKPLYTVEYDLKGRTVIQMHGLNNCTPPKDAQDYIRKWAKVIRGIQKNEKLTERRAAN